MSEKYGYAMDDESIFWGTYDSRDDAKDALFNETNADKGQTCALRKVSVEGLVDDSMCISTIFENMRDQLEEMVGDASEMFDYMPSCIHEKQTKTERALHDELVNTIVKYMHDNGIEINCCEAIRAERVERDEL